MNKLILLVFSISLVLLSCHNEKQNENASSAVISNTLREDQITMLDNLPDSLQPKSVELTSVPPPKVIRVPTENSNSYSKTNSNGKTEEINLVPPKISFLPQLKNKKGKVLEDKDGNPFIVGKGGKVNFTSFNTDNGLPLDKVNSCILDSKGNLWFGTGGAGLSRFDGNTFVNFTTDHGLSSNQILCLYEDKLGNIWIGTNDAGTCRYDGKTFTTFLNNKKSGNTVQSIVEDKNGILWFATSSGIMRYNGNTKANACADGSCAHQSKKDEDQKKHQQNIRSSFLKFSVQNGITDNNIKEMIIDREGQFWFCINNTLYNYDGKLVRPIAFQSDLNKYYLSYLAEDKNGNIWSGGKAGAIKINKSELKAIRSSPNLAVDQYGILNVPYPIVYNSENGLSDNAVSCIYPDSKGNIWIGTESGGVNKFNGNYMLSFTTENGLTNNIINCIQEDNIGNICIGTDGGGVCRYDGPAFTTISKQGDQDYFPTYSILEDKQGDFWFGTLGGGVNKFDGRTFTNFSVSQGLFKNMIRCLFVDTKGNLWIGTQGGGVSKYNGRTFTNYTTKQGLAGNVIFCIEEDDDGNLWFGTNLKGVSRFDGKKFTTYTEKQGLGGQIILQIKKDKKGNLWFASWTSGISCYNGHSFMRFNTDHGLANNRVYSILSDKNENLWFGTKGGGVSRMSKKILYQLHTTMDNLNPSSLLKSYTFSEPFFENFTTAQGLANNSVTGIIEDKKGQIVIGSILGLTVINEDATSLPFTTIKDKLSFYNQPNGFPVKDILDNALYCDSAGIIWAGTGSEQTALARINLSELIHSNSIPKVVIQNIRINEEFVNWYDLIMQSSKNQYFQEGSRKLEEIKNFGRELSEKERLKKRALLDGIKFSAIQRFYTIPKALVLPYENNNITFDFNAIETQKPTLVRYQYMLEGYDKKWSPILKKNTATFGNIREGTYTFKVKAQVANGPWSKPVSYTFKVDPPWYRTWLSFFAYALAVISTFIFYNKWRERSLINKNEALEKEVKTRTSFIEEQKVELEKKNNIVEKEKQRSEELLLNILPQEVAEELKIKGSAEAKEFDSVSVLFADIKGFTTISQSMTANELVKELHTCFKAFDQIMEKHNIEKIKTIGDCYMCASGLPIENSTHAVDMIHAALEMQEFMKSRAEQREALGKEAFFIRIGIHSGHVVAGIVGVKKFAYDIWGDTVNTASRMESSSEIGKINISGSTYHLVNDNFVCTYRGKIEAKGKGEIDMYFVEGEKSSEKIKGC